MFEDRYWVWLPSLLWALGGAFVGLLLEYIGMPLVRHLTRRTRWGVDDKFVASLRGMVFLWTWFLGISQAVVRAPLDARSVGWARNILFIAVVWTVCVVVSRLLDTYIRRQIKGQAQRSASASIISNLTALLTYLIGGLVVLQTLGISVTPVLTALGVGGLAVALALQPTLGNLFAGLQLIASRQINNGDYVRLQSGDEGHVVDISWRNTVVRSLSNNTIVVPNAQLASATIINYHLPDREMSIGVDLAVQVGTDLEKVEHVAVRTAREVMQRLQPGLKVFVPSVRFDRVEDGAIIFSVGLRVARYTDQYLMRHEFLKAITRSFSVHGIPLPIPRQALYIESHGQQYSPSLADRGQSASVQDP